MVLDAMEIPVEQVRDGDQWLLVVEASNASRAADELEAYRLERAEMAEEPSWKPLELEGAWQGVAIYIAIISGLGWWSSQQAFGFPWFDVGEMDLTRVREGDWWRPITALTLHVDFGHLLSNFVFGSLFGLLAGRAYGGGLAWLGIVAAGALGNLTAGLLKPAPVASIGASTAVFGALGMVAIYTLRITLREPQQSWLRWTPLVGGIVLFAFLGIGEERTDVTAHFTGMVCGAGLGWLLGRLPEACFQSSKLQVISGVIAVLAIVIAWSSGLAAVR